MGVEIRPVDLDRELDVLRDTFNANFPLKPGSPERFRWMYFENPDGRATAWFAIDDRTGAVAGCTAVLPRRVRLRESGRVVTAWNCSDFCINPAYRTLGVALKLRRAARDAVDAGDSAFLFAHPNDRMLQVHLRVGHRPLGTMVRFARPLRPASGPRLAKLAGRAALRFAGKDLVIPRRCDVEVIEGSRTPDDITEVYERAGSILGTSVVRDQRYIDWRFRRHPIEPAAILIVREAGRPAGYAAYVVRDDVAHVKDWLAVDAGARDQLFAALLGHCRSLDLATVSIGALESHPDIPALRAFGFIRRPECSTAIAYAGNGLGDAVTSAASWYMTVGDRDL